MSLIKVRPTARIPIQIANEQLRCAVFGNAIGMARDDIGAIHILPARAYPRTVSAIDDGSSAILHIYAIFINKRTKWARRTRDRNFIRTVQACTARTD